MSNLEKTLYHILRDNFTNMLEHLVQYAADGCNVEDLLVMRERVLYMLHMLDIVYGATKEGEDE